MVRVKICGVTSAADAHAAVEAGADAIGLNFVPTSPRYVGRDGGASFDHAITEAIPPFVQTVGVFADSDPRLVGVLSPMLDLLQFHGQEDAFDAGWFSRPAIRAIRVRKPSDLLEISKWSWVRGFLLDGAGRPGAHGGATFDWSLVGEARALTKKPIIIAGGLTPENVADAIRATRPEGVDVASGVESVPGRKDPIRMRDFIQAARSA